MREATLERVTKETSISMKLTITDNGCGGFKGASGCGFFDHMLNSFAVHGGFLIEAEINGDTDVDMHHTVEDTGIVLGRLFNNALADKSGIKRFGSAFIPMDESLAFAAADISGRPYLVFQAEFDTEKVGSYDTELTVEFFRALAFNMNMTLHIKLEYGENAHHETEAIYKAVAHAISDAATETGSGVLSAKGTLI